MSHPSIKYRLATAADMEGVHALVRELADFEKASDAVYSSAESFREDAFESESPWFTCFVAEEATAGIVGIALCYKAYSTWRGKMLFLDDLVVTESFRRQGIGKELLTRVIEYAKSIGTNMIKWQVLDWNEPAIRMYESLGVTFDGEWIDCKLYF